jgi:hypothetical protein
LRRDPFTNVPNRYHMYAATRIQVYTTRNVLFACEKKKCPPSVQASEISVIETVKW